MNIRTGQTVYEDILSVDADNNPVSATTFDTAFIRDGSIYTAITATITLADDSRAIFTASWSADTVGSYQLYAKNNVTNVIFISDRVDAKPDSEFDQNIYIGL
jgi:hypothetical protein